MTRALLCRAGRRDQALRQKLTPEHPGSRALDAPRFVPIVVEGGEIE